VEDAEENWGVVRTLEGGGVSRYGGSCSLGNVKGERLEFLYSY